MNTPPSEDEVKKAAEMLDRLLGVEARKPGAAAELPAVVRVIEELEPAGGFEFPVFPSSYAGVGDNDPPVYDLAGIAYGEVIETIRGKGRTTVQRPQVIRADRCTLDSPQSQANRTEVAFLEDEDLRNLVPQASAQTPRSDGAKRNQSVLLLPHRVADFRVRLSDRRKDVEAAINNFADGDALDLLRLMPTSIVFGFWDSRGKGSQPKHARILLSRIDAFDVIPCRRHALYSGPYSADEFAAAVLDKETAGKAEKDTMAEKGYTPAPSEGLGGVVAKRIERLALVSLTDIRRIRCSASAEARAADPELANASSSDAPSGRAEPPAKLVDKDLTNAARRYVFALAALAEGYPRYTGSHRLRSGCELLTNRVTVDLRGGDPNHGDEEKLKDLKELKELFTNRALLQAVAKQAKEWLKVPDRNDDFVVSREALKDDFEGKAASNVNGSHADATPAAEPKGKRTRTK
jgi:CRISPR-associated protein Csb1